VKDSLRIQKSRLGQNFLIDEAATLAVVDALGDLSTTTVLEIGPGHGALTSLLAARSQRLIALEIDPQLAAENRATFAGHPNVTILEADVLRADIPALIAPAQTASIIGNLPYYITSDILLKLFTVHPHLSRAVIMVQREVAERIAAPPGSSDYGLLSATTQLYATVDLLFTLPPTAFSPPPEVHSSVLRLLPAEAQNSPQQSPRCRLSPRRHRIRRSLSQHRPQHPRRSSRLKTNGRYLPRPKRRLIPATPTPKNFSTADHHYEPKANNQAASEAAKDNEAPHPHNHHHGSGSAPYSHHYSPAASHHHN
jgi:ribosomal RNA small subunit methyltransferase A